MSFKSFMAFWNGEDAPVEENERPPLSEQIKNYYKKKKEWVSEKWSTKKRVIIILGGAIFIAYLWVTGWLASVFRAVASFSGNSLFDRNAETVSPQIEFFHAVASLAYFPHNIFAIAVVSLGIGLFLIWWIRNHVTMGDYSVEKRAGASYKKQIQDATLGSAREMTEEEIRKKFLVLSPLELKRNNPNTLIFGYREDLKSYILGKPVGKLEVPNQNCFAIGDAGSRKTTNFILTNIEQLAQAGHNMIITDTAGELFASEYPKLIKEGYDVWAINTNNTEHSDTGNFIGAVGNDLDLAKTITQTLVEATHERSDRVDPFFEGGMKTLLPGIIILVNTEMRAYSSIGGIIDFIKKYDNREKIGNVFELYKESQPEAYEQYMLFQTSPVADNFIANLSQRLDVFVSTGIKRICSEEGLNFIDAFGTEKKTALFIITDKNYAFIGALYLNLAAKILKAYARDECENRILPRKLYFCLEEFLTMGYVPNMGTYLSELRKFGIVFWLICQAIPQFYKVYEEYEAKEIMSNCVYKFFYGTGDTDTAEEFEKYCGAATVRTMMKATSNPIIKQTDQAREGVQQRMLWDANELMTLDINNFILFTTHEHPLELQKPYYKTIPGRENVVDEEVHYSGYIPHKTNSNNMSNNDEAKETDYLKESKKSDSDNKTDNNNVSKENNVSTTKFGIPTLSDLDKEKISKLTPKSKNNHQKQKPKPRISARVVEKKMMDEQMVINLIDQVEEQTINRPCDNEDQIYYASIGSSERFFKNDANPEERKHAFRVRYDIPFGMRYEGNLPNNTYKSRNSRIFISKDLADVKVYDDGKIHVGWSRIYDRKNGKKDDYYFKEYAEKKSDLIKDVINVPECDIIIQPIMRKITGYNTEETEYQPRNEAVRNLKNRSGQVASAIMINEKL